MISERVLFIRPAFDVCLLVGRFFSSLSIYIIQGSYRIRNSREQQRRRSMAVSRVGGYAMNAWLAGWSLKEDLKSKRRYPGCGGGGGKQNE